MKRKRGITIRFGALGLSLLAAGITAVGVAAVSLADSGNGSGSASNGSGTQTFQMPAPPRRCARGGVRGSESLGGGPAEAGGLPQVHGGQRRSGPARPEQVRSERRPAEAAQRGGPGEAAEGLRGLQEQASRSAPERGTAPDRPVRAASRRSAPAGPEPGAGPEQEPEQSVGHAVGRLGGLNKTRPPIPQRAAPIRGRSSFRTTRERRTPRP